MGQAAAIANESSRKETLDSLVRLYGTLLEVSEAIASHRDLGALMHDLAPRLHGLVEFDGLALILHGAAPKTMCLYLLEGADLKANPAGVEMPAEETPAGWVVETQQAMLVPDIDLRKPVSAHHDYVEGRRHKILLPAALDHALAAPGCPRIRIAPARCPYH